MEGVILASWDYIMGPQVEKLWLIDPSTNGPVAVPSNILRDFNINKHYSDGNSSTSVTFDDLKLYSMICGQLLLGEVSSSIDVENNSLFYISGFKILISVVFCVKSWCCTGTEKEVENVKLCFGTIFKNKDLHLVQQNQAVVDIYMRRAAKCLQHIEVSMDATMVEVSVLVKELASLLDTLHHQKLNSVRESSQLMLQGHHTLDILPIIIASHLQTSGHTAIFGSSEFMINQVLQALSLFSSKQELSSSLSVPNYSLKPNSQGLYIQSIIKESERDCENLLEKAFREHLPLTVIDIDKCKVWQTWYLHRGIDKHKKSCEVSEVGNLVPQLLNDLSFTQKCSRNDQSVVETFLKFLMMKSISLIKAVLYFRQSGKRLSGKEVMNMIGLQSEGDLLIVLGYAEKLRPGIRNAIA